MVLHLFPARAAGLHVLFRVSLDFRLAKLAALDRVSQILEPDGQLRSVNLRGIALGGEKLLGLEGAGLFLASGAALPFGDVENHGMGMELGRGVAFNGAGRVVIFNVTER